MRVLISVLLAVTVAAGQAASDVASVLSKGRQLAEHGEPAKAQELYESALTHFTDNSDLRFELGMVYFRQGKWAQAADSYNRSLTKSPKRIKALFYLAESYFMQSDLDHAIESIARAAHIAPDDAQVCQKYGQYLSMKLETRNQGLAQLQRARRLNPGLEHIDFEIGKTHFDLTDFQSAAGSFEIALKKTPEDGRAAFFLAESNARLGEWQKARRSYEYALAHGCSDAATYYGLGQALAQLGDFESAINPLQQALALQPSLVQAHFQLSRAYRRLGLQKEAKRQARLFDAMNNRIDTSRDLLTPEEEDAGTHIKPMLQNGEEFQALQYLAKLPGPDSFKIGESYFLLGTIYFSTGRTEDAKRVLWTARTLSPDDSRIAAFLGMTQLANGETETADTSFHSALALDRDNPLALIGMGALRYQQQRWADAIEYLERSRTADPDILSLLCDAYYRIGKLDEAQLTVEVIRAFGANRKPLLDRLETLPHAPSN